MIIIAIKYDKRKERRKMHMFRIASYFLSAECACLFSLAIRNVSAFPIDKLKIQYIIHCETHIIPVFAEENNWRPLTQFASVSRGGNTDEENTQTGGERGEGDMGLHVSLGIYFRPACSRNHPF